MADLVKSKALIFDLQATGPGAQNHHAIEMGYSVFEFSKENSEVVTHLLSLPLQAAISRRVAKLTGIDHEMLEKDGITREKAIKLLKKNSRKLPFVVHFAQFETPFLADYYDHKLPLIICTHKVAKRLFPQLPSKSLRSVSGHLGYPISELKRSDHHVNATLFIWQKMLPMLLDMGFKTYEEVLDWTKNTKPKKAKKAFSITAEKRLGLPKESGVYRMLDGNKSVLYVGKAKNLKTRVSSYFTGQKTKGSRLNEMLSQVKDVSVTKTISPCHAALLEADLIKAHHPPYNRALKAQMDVAPCFSRGDFSVSPDPIESVFGPFRSERVLEEFMVLKEMVLDESFLLARSGVFFDEVNEEVLREGILAFFMGKKKDAGVWRRLILECLKESVAKAKRKKEEQGSKGDASASAEEEEEKVEVEVEGDEEEEDDDDEIEEDNILTAEDVTRYIRSFLAYFGRRIHRGRWLLRLSHCQIVVTHHKSGKADFKEYILVEEGKVSFFKDLKALKPLKKIERKSKRALFDLETFDRLTVLYHELKRLLKEENEIKIHFHDGSFLTKPIIAKFMFLE